MNIEKEDFERLRQLKAIQAANCRKTKPWQKSTGPKTAQGKKKVSQNLPLQDKVSRAIRSLRKLDEVIAKLHRTEERSQKGKLTKLEKFKNLTAGK